MGYAVKEIFYTLQGEGARTGRASVFCRFSGCNLWSGREADRHEAQCRFCDTDFIGVDGPGGGKFPDATDLAAAIDACWDGRAGEKYVVCTGGEPFLQLDLPLITALHDRGFIIAVETNGTIAAPDGIDWICVSPKADTILRQCRGDELKLVWPQTGIDPEELLQLDFDHFFLQPMDGPDQTVAVCIRYCLDHPQWRLSLQTHKMIGIA